MTNEEASSGFVSDARRKLADYIVEAKISQSQAAREMGVSRAVISTFLKESYAGDNAEIARKAEQFISIGTARQVVALAPEICLSVGNTQQILGKVRVAHISGEIALIYGPAGCGKSTALKHYARNNNGVVYVECDVSSGRPRAVMELIFEAMGETARGTNAQVMRALITGLTDTNRLIIVDEAQHLNASSLDMLRALKDKAHVGIVYSGNPKLLKQMYGRQEEVFDQLFSRIEHYCSLRNNYSRNDIASIYSGFGFNAECLQYLHNVSKRKGGLRLMVNQGKVAQNLAGALQEDFSTEHLDKAAERMGIGSFQSQK